MIEKKLVAIDLATSEVPRAAIDPDRGERVDRGRVIAPLPATMKPCPVVYDEPVVRHDVECDCHGTGMVPVQVPRDIDVVDPEDDSLMALEDALETGDTSDAYLGDSVTNLMRHPIDVSGGGGGGGGRKGRQKAIKIDADAPRSAIDGRLERTGRKPRFVKTGPRKDTIGTTVATETTKTMGAVKADIAELADMLLANPEYQATLAELKSPGAVIARTEPKG